MKFLVTLALVFGSTFCFADCFKNFSQGRDSASHQVNVSDVTGVENLYESTKFAIKKLATYYGCGDIAIRELRCDYLIKNMSESNVCYARTNLGYFIVNKDYVENVNVTFNRFD